MLQFVSISLSSKTCLFLGLAALCGITLGEVGDFSRCLQFFYKHFPPKGLEIKECVPICQFYQNQYCFASIYCRTWRTPLYSAYLFTAGGTKRPKVPWQYEPQLANSRAGPQMRAFPSGPVDQNVLESQAVLQDYKNSSYTKGHLSPNLHHRETLNKKATFTLTNIVPQQLGSNSGPWAHLELEVRDRLTAYCTGPAYIVTGVLPYTKMEHYMKNRVAVPEYMWSAYCCPSFNSSLSVGLNVPFPSYAAIGRNDPLSDAEIVPVDGKARKSVRGYDVRRMPLKTLQMYLQQRLGGSLSIFENDCL